MAAAADSPPLSLSPDEFRSVASRAVDACGALLATLDERPVKPAITGEQSVAELGGAPPEVGLGPAALDALERIFAASRTPNGRFFGYVLGSGEPVAAVGDLIASVLNQNVTAWRSSPAAVTIERAVIQWIASAVGAAGFTGSLLSGGSMANLAGLALAREQRAPANEAGARPGAIYITSETHTATRKAVALLGLGTRSLRAVATDAELRMQPDALEEAMAEDERRGVLPLAVVASAGTTATGSIDPIPEIAQVAKRRGAWLHVDGAYGGFAAMAVPEKLPGFGLADSIALDPHKWLYQPLDCGCLLFREPAAARAAFSASAELYRSMSADPVEGFAFFEESPELSRRFRALKIWLSLRYHGVAAFRAAIRKDLDLAQRLAARVDAAPELERLAPVPLSAVCFRWVGDRTLPESALEAKNAALLNAVNARGRVYLSNARVRGHFALRACLTNHRTRPEDVDAVVTEVLQLARAS
ncbi:MAG TPA: aminotransferase class V-fold PLP-dependent enzyme [Myxococcales bacterium]|nr:aminotransferase class V-fold PLP-dependent enzyme [Myxococcales bacterium]